MDLSRLEKPTEYFQSLGIPLPHAQAILVGATECKPAEIFGEDFGICFHFFENRQNQPSEAQLLK